MTDEQIQNCRELATYLIDKGYLKKVEGIHIKFGKYGYPTKEGNYFVVYFDFKYLIKYIIIDDFKGMPVFIRPFNEYEN